MRKKGFTLIEMVLTLVTFSIVFGILFTLFLRMIRMKTDIEARQLLIQNTYDTVEKINVMLQDYTIDYEEYFDRSMVGCSDISSWGDKFDRSVGWSGNCNVQTNFGNSTALLDGYSYVEDMGKSQHMLYACSSFLGGATMAWPNGGSDEQDVRLMVWYNKTDWDMACINEFHTRYESSPNLLLYGFRQPYGAYKVQFLDVKDDVDDKFWRAWDDDDTDTGKWPPAVFDNNNVKELYLISKDKKKRILLRRSLLAQGDWNNDGTVGDIDSENLYTIQMLQLKAFDAGVNHDFDVTTYSGVYDGTIDTRACDIEAWFTCKGPSLWGVYSGYHLPDVNNPQDWWINITSNDLSVADWNMKITPTKDPDYAWWEASQQRNPFITLYIKTAIYWENRVNKIGVNNVNSVVFDLQTSFNIKTNY